MQQDESGVVLLVAAESDGDLVAPAAEHEAPHQDRLVGEDEGFSAARILHGHLLALQHAHIEHLKQKITHRALSLHIWRNARMNAFICIHSLNNSYLEDFSHKHCTWKKKGHSAQLLTYGVPVHSRWDLK